MTYWFQAYIDEFAVDDPISRYLAGHWIGIRELFGFSPGEVGLHRSVHSSLDR